MENKSIAPIEKIRSMISSEYVQKKFMDILGERASTFLASVLNAVQQNDLLVKAEPKSVMTAAMAAAVLNLPIDKNLGFAAIVPYKKDGVHLAQFQIMTRGYIQLAQRTGHYSRLNVSEVFQDEFISYNYVTGDLELKESPTGGQRDNDEREMIVGYVAYFKLDSGFEKLEYWPVGKIDAHGKRFSKTFANPASPWVTNREAMRAKTVLKNTIAKWGPLSIEMQRAVNLDQGVAGVEFTGRPEDSMGFLDNPTNGEDENNVIQNVIQEKTSSYQAGPKVEEKKGPVKAEKEKSKEGLDFEKLDRPEMVSKIVTVIESIKTTPEKLVEYKTRLKADLKLILKGQDNEKAAIWAHFQNWSKLRDEINAAPPIESKVQGDIVDDFPEDKTKPGVGLNTPLRKALSAIEATVAAIEAMPEEVRDTTPGGLGLF